MGIATTPLKSLPEDERSFADMLDRHKRHISYVGAAILIVGAGAWFYNRSKALKEERAETAYRNAMQSVVAGNVPLAQSDLKKLTVRYDGTAAGTLGAMELAKLSYDQGKYQTGIEALKSATDGPDYLKYDVQTLLAAGYDGLGKWMDAASSYEAAAKSARFESDRTRAEANAARAYENAGNRNVAIKIWTELSKDSSSPVSDEAKVRLGELKAQVTKV